MKEDSPAAPHGALKSQAVRGWTFTMLSQVAGLAMITASTAVLARLLSPDDFGLVAMVASTLVLLTSFKDLGLSVATVQRAEITHEQCSCLFWVNLGVGVLLMVAVACCAPFIGWFYARDELVVLSLAYAVLMPISSLGAQHRALMEREMRYKTIAVNRVVSQLLGVTAGLISASLGARYWALVIMQGTTDAIRTVLSWLQSGWRPSWSRNWTEVSPLFRFGASVTLSNVLGFFLKGFDSVVLGHYFGAASLGLYNRAQNVLVRPLEQVIPPVMNVAIRVFAKVKDDHRRFESAANLLLFMIMCVCGFIVALTAVFADWLVLVLLGRQWAEAVPIVRVLVLFAFIEPAAALFATLLISRGLPNVLVRWRLFSVIIVVAGIFAGLPWGLIGVAVSFSLSGFFIRAPLFLWYASRKMRFDLNKVLKAVYPTIVAALVTVSFLWTVRAHADSWHYSNLLTVVSAGVAGLLYLCVIFAFPHGRRSMANAIGFLKDGFAHGRLSTAEQAAASPGASTRPRSVVLGGAVRLAPCFPSRPEAPTNSRPGPEKA